LKKGLNKNPGFRGMKLLVCFGKVLKRLSN
jgi:hypothetical protein